MMERNETRKPKQQRSIDKKNTIINSAYKLFGEHGFFKTNISDIAKCSHISSGTIYDYFKDKKDIIMSVLEMYIDKMYTPIFNVLDNLLAPIDIAILASYILDISLKSHKEHMVMHNQIMTLSHVYSEVSVVLVKLQEKIIKLFVEKFNGLQMLMKNGYEKIHIAFNMIENFEHDVVCHHHSNINYDVMKTLVHKHLVEIFEEKMINIKYAVTIKIQI